MPIENEHTLRMTPVHLGMYYHSLVDSGMYIQQICVAVEGPLLLDKFLDAWKLAHARHDMLRASISQDDSFNPIFSIHNWSAPTSFFTDWSELSAQRQRTEWERIVTRSTQLPFDLSTPPLSRLLLIRHGVNDHRVIWCYHHLILDGWSVTILLSELLAIYRSLVEQRNIPLVSAPSYRNYLLWREGQNPEEARAYWAKRAALFDESGRLPMSVQEPVPADPSSHTALRSRMTQEEAVGLQLFARNTKVTLGTIIQGAWAIVLGHYCGTRLVSFGSVTSGRPSSLRHADRMVGLFLNTLPTVIHVPYDEDLGAWLRSIQEQSLKDREFEWLSLAEIIQTDPGSALDSVVVVQNYPTMSQSADPSAIKIRYLASTDRTNFPILVTVTPTEVLDLRITFDTTRISGELANALLSDFRHTLAMIASAPPRLRALVQGKLPKQTVSPVTRELSVPHEALRPVHVLISEQSRISPTHVALETDQRAITYADLERQSDEVAFALLEEGLRSEDVVALSVSDEIDSIMLTLGVLKAGGCYAPFDIDAQEIVARLISPQSGVFAVIVDPGKLERLACGKRALSSEWVLGRHSSQYSALPKVHPDQVAYVMHTSGSTGVPKGVQVTHRNLANVLESFRVVLQYNESDVFLSVTPLTFDIAGLEIFLPLISGSRVVRVAVHSLPGGDRFSRLLLDHEVTTMQATPTVWEHLLATGWVGEGARLRALSGGEKLSLSLANRLRDVAAEVWNLYGPTETTIWSTANLLVKHDQSVTVGYPIHNTQVYVADWKGDLSPSGGLGELLVGGTGVARGYWDRPDLTAERFRPNPFSRQPGERLYCTGDRAVQFEGDEVLVLGRVDNQVKIRGVRIEPEEIENELSRHPAIQQCAVVPVDVDGSRSLKAFFVKQQGHDVTANQLQDFLSARLSAVKIPAYFVDLPLLPRTPNNKIDRKRLRSEANESTSKSSYVPPATPTEMKITRIWEQVLGKSQVGATQSFFQLGGHSLNATVLAARIESEVGVRIPMTTLLHNPTVQRLSTFVEEERDRVDFADGPKIKQIEPDLGARFEPFPMTDVQEAYFVGRLNTVEFGGISTQIYFEAELDRFDLSDLQDACNVLIERHGMLRAVFAEDGTQRILPTVPPLTIPVVDLSLLSETSKIDALNLLRSGMSQQILHTGKWPLFDIRISVDHQRTYRLHVSVDNLLADAASLRLLVRELETLYRDRTALLPPLQITFRDCVLALNAPEGTLAHDQAWQYWKDKIITLPPAPQLPLVKPIAPSSTRFVRRGFRLDARLWERIKHRASVRGLSRAAVLIRAYAEILRVWSSDPAFTLTLTLFNRPPIHPQIDQVFGDFTSISLLECDLSSGKTFGMGALELQQRLWTDLDNRAVSGIRVLRELARNARNRSQTLMPVVFTSMLDIPQDRGPGGLFRIGRPQQNTSQTAQVWIDNQVFEESGDLVCNWDSVDALFPAELVEDMFETYKRFLWSLAENAAAWDSSVPDLVPPQQLLERDRANTTFIPSEPQTLYSLFQKRLNVSSTDTAVISASGDLSYAELAARADAVASHLLLAGVGDGDLVGIAMRRGWEQAAAALGILQSGAAYVPIDLDNPIERIRKIVSNSGAKIVLTQSWADLDRTMLSDLVSVEDVDGLQEIQSPRQIDRSTPKGLAYVIYTSGSTGVPKGVMIEHAAAVNTVVNVSRLFNVDSTDRFLGVSSLSFDLSVYDLFGAFAAGATLVMLNDSKCKDPAHWTQLMQQYKVTVWNSAPALMKLLTEYLELYPEYEIADLRLAMLSGDWIPVSLPDTIWRINPRVRIIGLGGATEAAIWSNFHEIDVVDPTWPSIPYGKPLPNQAFHVLDKAFRNRPVWVPGDLYIAGHGLARGYFNDSVRTKEHFVEHPVTGETFYRTGDMGRYLPGGDIEFLGRRDSQVKINGFRVELGEIETAILEQFDIRNVAVLPEGENEGSRHLVAYLVARDKNIVNIDLCRERLRQKLPAYMLPAVFRIVREIPLTRNGKVDVTALRNSTPIFQNAIEVERYQAESANPPLRAILNIVREVMPSFEIEESTSLFAAGANSIDLIRITNRLDKELHFRPSIDDFYSDPTVKGLVTLYELHELSRHITRPSNSIIHTEKTPFHYELLTDPNDRNSFKRRQPSLRKFPRGVRSIELEQVLSEAQWIEEYENRRTHRTFGSRPITKRDLAALLEVGRQVVVQEETHRLYPSAGGLYPIQIYGYIKPGGVAGMSPGGFYYDPAKHSLFQFNNGITLDNSIHEPFVNRPIFDACAFSLFLIADLHAIGPIYGESSISFCLIEAGYLAQALMTHSAKNGIGLCPIGEVRDKPIRELFQLQDGHILAHSVVGGTLATENAGSEREKDVDLSVGILVDGIEQGVV